MLIAGVDEAGRGPLAGPVVAAAVILDPARPLRGLRDSKLLTAAARERLAVDIRAGAVAWSVALADVGEIDNLNILQATLLAMRRAVEGLALAPGEVLVDGNQCPRLACKVRAIVRGDRDVAAISAASIWRRRCATRCWSSWMRCTPATASPATRGTARRSTLPRSTGSARARFIGAASRR